MGALKGLVGGGIPHNLYVKRCPTYVDGIFEKSAWRMSDFSCTGYKERQRTKSLNF